MKIIPLSQGRFAKIDDEDFERVSQFKWCTTKAGDCFYARRTVNKSPSCEKSHSILLHRFILKIEDKSIIVDHNDHDTLNCQKYNLRVCTKSENNRNKLSAKNSSSRFLGVTKRTITVNGKIYNYWFSSISVKNKSIHIGSFKFNEEGEILAAKAYNESATKHFGQYANLNEI